MLFPISGVEVNPIFLLLFTFIVSFFTSTAGVSGAFLLLPFQMSILGFVSPSVSPTNLVYNIVAIPSGVYRYIKEGRMAWALVGVITLGTLPGLFVGAILRIKFLPDPAAFKFFAGLVLAYIAFKLFNEIRHPEKLRKEKELKFLEKMQSKHKDPAIKTINLTFTEYSFTFYGEKYSISSWRLTILCLIVGVVGGTYGIGGGAIIAPFLIAVFRVPVYTVAGAALFGTFLASVIGVIFYTLIAPFYVYTGLSIVPDWKLGFIFGIGGFLGIYCGARLQKYMPSKIIKTILCAIMTIVALRYILGAF